MAKVVARRRGRGVHGLITAIDTNVLSALWSEESFSTDIAERLEDCGRTGPLIICAPVYCELRAHPLLDEAGLFAYLDRRSIAIDWVIEREVWERAASQLLNHARRRRQNRVKTPTRLLADFLIGAHASTHADQLFTFDANRYRTYFPNLRLIEPTLIH